MKNNKILHLLKNNAFQLINYWSNFLQKFLFLFFIIILKKFWRCQWEEFCGFVWEGFHENIYIACNIKIFKNAGQFEVEIQSGYFLFLMYDTSKLCAPPYCFSAMYHVLGIQVTDPMVGSQYGGCGIGPPTSLWPGLQDLCLTLAAANLTTPSHNLILSPEPKETQISPHLSLFSPSSRGSVVNSWLAQFQFP